MASVAASLLLLASPAHAGSYTDTQSGGTTPSTVTPAADISYSYPRDAVAGGAPPPSGHGAPTITVNPGKITDTFNWTPASGQTLTSDPPPSCVIVDQDSYAEWHTIDEEGNGTTDSGNCDCGLSGATIVSNSGDPYGPALSKMGTLWSVKTSPGASFSVSCSPTASFTGQLGSSGYLEGEAKVSVDAANAYPVTINPFGATSDGNGGWVIMIGEHFTPELVGIPSGCTVSNYSWTVSGTTLQSWTVSSDSKTTTEVDGSGALNVEQPGWYWNDLQATTVENVTCTATVTPPPGQGSSFTVTASQPVTVYRPIWTGTGTGGYVKVNNYPGSTNSSQYYIFTGPTTNMVAVGNQDGMSFNASVKSPVPDLISAGSLELVQLVTPREATTTFNGYNTEVNFFPQYGEEGLDGAYPYGWIKESNPPGPYTYFTGDTPYILLQDQVTYAATLKHDFQDFLMFLAPGSQQYVPVAHFIWSDDGNAQIPSTRLWKDYASEHGGSDSAGTVTPSGNDATFLSSNVFPMWTQID